MCGIAGIVLKNKIDADTKFNKFRIAAKLLSHRGPDFNDEYLFENVLLIHYRLSIIDLGTRSNQPFFSTDKNQVCIYNGEIYNFQELKIRYNINTRTTSDTEIMLESFIKFGLSAVQTWNGIFASAIFDIQNRKLSLIRDRFGVKPLYFFENDQVIMFASEAKVMMNWLDSMELDYEGLAQYLWYGNTISEHTIIKGIKKISPGTILEIDIISGKTILDLVFWDIPTSKVNNIYRKVASDELYDLLDKAVERQLISDVPIGVLLSGGIDSSAIVAIASQYIHNGLDTYSVEYDFNIGGKSELQNAALLAKMYKTNHHELKITSNDVLNIFQNLVFQYDEPFADSASIPLYQLAKACSFDKKVILQGDGGDELFGGYRRYNILDWLRFWQITSNAIYRLIPNKQWNIRMKRMSFVLNQKSDALRMAYFLTQDVPDSNPFSVLGMQSRLKINETNPFDRFFELNEQFAEESKVQKMMFTEVKLLNHGYLEKVDKATMLASVESRVPFLDNDLADFALRLPARSKIRDGEKKYLLKEALQGILPKNILYGKKKGFGVPYKHWLRSDLYEFALNSFNSLPENGLLDKTILLRYLKLHKNGDGNYGSLLWKSLVLTFWLHIYNSKIRY